MHCEVKSHFTLYSSVFFWLSKKEVLFYNTDSFSSKEYLLNESIRLICTYLSEPCNLYHISCSNIDKQELIFLDTLYAAGFGTFHSTDEEIISLPPILKIYNDWRIIKDDNQLKSSAILPYLTELTVFLGGRTNCSNAYYIQTEYPFPNSKYLSEDLLQDVIKLSTTKIRKFNFVFSDISQYPNIEKILRDISILGPRATLFINDLDCLDENKLLLSSFQDNCVIVHNPGSCNIKGKEKFCHHFLVDSQSSYYACASAISDHKIEEYDIIPIFNGHNQGFIKENLFLSYEDIIKSRLSKRHIFLHQVANLFSFGKLYVIPTGEVFSNIMGKSLGIISDSVYELILAELTANLSWRHTRYEIENCRGCKLRGLCPSPSIIEEIVGVECICNDIK